MNRRLTALRLAILTIAIGISGPPVVIVLATAGLPMIGAIITAAIIFAITIPLVIRELPDSLERGIRPRLLFTLWFLLCSLVVYQMGKHSIFMYDVNQSEYAFKESLRPVEAEGFERIFYATHNCYTCYIIGAHLASERAENVYARNQYRDAEIKTDIHHEIGDALTVDTYQYPPPFLLLPKLMLTLGDFYESRAYWHALNVGVICLAVVLTAAWIGGRSFGFAWFALPIILVAPVTIGALQIGNVHLLIICISVLAMLAFDHGRPWIGGMLLGFAVLSKLFPGLLLGYLVVTRRWRPAMWTCLSMFFFVGLTVLVFGPQPFHAFFDHQLPRLASGDAFGFSRKMLRPMTVNLSMIGVAFKLDHLGWLGEKDPLVVSKTISMAYTALLAFLLAAIGFSKWRRQRKERSRFSDMQPTIDQAAKLLAHRRREVITWLAILILAELRSPFLPWGYANLPILWLLTLLIAALPSFITRRSLRYVLQPALLILTTAFTLNIPLFAGPPTEAFDMIFAICALVIVLTMCILIVITCAKSYGASPK